jgi:hypothetical protein
VITSTWTKSSRSSSTGSCVEVRRTLDGNIQVRDSKDPSGPVLAFSRDEWIAFIRRTKAGNFQL